MAEKDDLLFELGTEELPPKSLKPLISALKSEVQLQLEQSGFGYESIHAYASPRRLALLLGGLDRRQPDRISERKGPALSAAFDLDGTPGKAALGFARSCGVEIDQLQTMKTERGEWLCFQEHTHGETVEQRLPGIIRESLSKLPIARRMRWGSSDIEFVRPVHWAVLLYGQQWIRTEILGVQTQSFSIGHRFLANTRIEFEHAAHYADTLAQQGKVIVDCDTRKQKIVKLATEAAEKIGGIVSIDPQLLDEITALVEWPVAILGKFDTHFLKLPPEVLVTTMQSNQKYFPVRNNNSELLPYFVTISNIESTHPASIVKGNERVIKPRLADADFFWTQDRKQPLTERAAALQKIIFQHKLGTLADKSRRVASLCLKIAAQLDRDATLSQRAAELAKTDLVTHMVGEFPSLQGTVGRYYATADGEPNEIAVALEEQYLPRQSGGALPETGTGEILSVAEKIDTLAGIFGAGLIPSGDRDPFGLRRAAIGALRIIVEKQLDLDLLPLLDTAVEQLPAAADNRNALAEVRAFIVDRFRGYCLENGYKHDEFEAVLATNSSRPVDFELRMRAVKHFRTLSAAESLSAANKRIRNILRQAEITSGSEINPSLLGEQAETRLWQRADAAHRDITPLLENRDYSTALTRLADLKEPVDHFFDTVMVMSDDPKLQANRLALLNRIEDLFLQIADISRLQ